MAAFPLRGLLRLAAVDGGGELAVGGADQRRVAAALGAALGPAGVGAEVGDLAARAAEGQPLPVFETWEKQVFSARGFKRVGRHSEYVI